MEKGTTLIELVIVVLVIGILASVTIPVAKTAVVRTQEIELKRNLRTIREAIDKYKDNYDKGVYKDAVQVDATGYPLSLNDLVKRRVLRRIPLDPFNDEADPMKCWGVKSSTDERNSTMTNGRDVYDIYSKCEGVAIDGTKYKEW